MSVAAIIPARFSSQRLPGKPLLKETGKYLIQHVYERIREASKVDEVLIATDDERILQASESFGARAFMTSDQHPSGTDRIAEVAVKLKHQIVLNIQGDEPEVEPDAVDQLVGMLDDPEVRMATLAVPISDEDLFNDPNVVKVVVDNQADALYFSRSSVPYHRPSDSPLPESPVQPLHHIGIYAFRREFLLEFVSLPQGRLEQLERLEQLRVLEHGYRIRVGLRPSGFPGIDTAEDYQAFVERCGS